MTPPAPPSVTLLPCPFCGDENPVVAREDADAFWLVGCTNCMTQGPAKLTEAEAITAWNTRTNAEAASAARVAQAIRRELALTQLSNFEDASIDWLEGFECARVLVRDILAKHQQGEVA